MSSSKISSREGHFTRRALLAGATAAVVFTPAAGRAAPIAFSGDWQHLTFMTLSANEFTQRGQSLGVVADGSSSILYKTLDPGLHDSTTAEWNWTVSQSVPPSDLSDTGNDDRNLSVFFVSVDAATAERLSGNAGIRSLMNNNSARVLMYTWGGGKPVGSVVPSPQAPDRLRNLITRPAGTGSFTERVNLASDFQQVFGQSVERLVAVAVSSNNENSDARVEAEVSNLSVG